MALPGSKRHDLRIRLALSLCAAMVALTGAEIGLRIVAVDLNPDPCLRYHRDLGWTLDSECDRLDRITRAGFRQTHEPDRAAARRRVVVLGDSFSVGAAFPYSLTYPSLLESRLNATSGGDGAPWEVVNLSGVDWGTAQQLIAMRRYGVDLKPEAVVLQVFPFNDVCNNSIGMAFLCSHLDPHRPYFVVDSDRLRLTQLSPLRARARAISRIFGVLETQLGWGVPFEEPGLSRTERRARRQDARHAATLRAELTFSALLYTMVPEPEQRIVRDGWQVTERLLNEVVGLCREQGIPLVALVIPFAEIFNPDWLSENRAAERDIVPGHATSKVEGILRSRGSRVISVRERIVAGSPGWRSYFFPHGLDDRHFSEVGHARVADWILEDLLAPAEDSIETPG